MIRKHFLIPFACCAVLSSFSTQGFAGLIGSGKISGVFTDDVITVGAPQTFLFGEFSLPLGLPVSVGAGTSTYQWGLGNVPSRYYFDGVEYSFEDILVLLAGIPQEEWLTRYSLEFGISENLLSFQPDEFSDQPKGEPFVAGLLEFHNGQSLSGSAVPSVTLTLDTLSVDPDFTQSLDVPISIVSTTNVFDDAGNILDVPSADFIYFTDHPEFGSFRVFEDQSTSVEVLVEFNSLDLIGFGAVTDPSVGFVSQSVTSVPEPSSLALAAIGLFALGAHGLRRRQKTIRP